MGLRFRKSFKIVPGVRVNLSKKGVGTSFGIPGTGISWVNSPGRSAGSGCSGCLMVPIVGFFALLFITWLSSDGRRHVAVEYVHPRNQYIPRDEPVAPARAAELQPMVVPRPMDDPSPQPEVSEAWKELVRQRELEEAKERQSRLKRIEDAEVARKKQDDEEQHRKQAARAASLMASAQNLERMGKPAGAIGFYRTIVKECPDTTTAGIAAERIKALGSK